MKFLGRFDTLHFTQTCLFDETGKADAETVKAGTESDKVGAEWGEAGSESDEAGTEPDSGEARSEAFEAADETGEPGEIGESAIKVSKHGRTVVRQTDLIK